MEIQVNINAEAVQKQVTEAILNSAIGEQIAKAVDEALRKNVGTGFHHKTIVQQAVDEVVHQVIFISARDAVGAKREQIKEQIAARLTDDALNALVEAMWSSAFDKTKDR